jgi:hypothetical protein
VNHPAETQMRKASNGFWKSWSTQPAHSPQQTTSTPRPAFPIAEGLGIFFGVIGWDLLSDGQLEVIKAALVTAPATLVWFGLRCWNERRRERQRQG